MNTKSGFRSRIQIAFYSALISLMSGLNHIRSRLEPRTSHGIQPPEAVLASVPVESTIVEYTTKPSIWSRTAQAFTAFIIWTVLGFSAGFLLGIIQLR